MNRELTTDAGKKPARIWKDEYTIILFIGGMFANLAVAVLNGAAGFFYRSPWQGTLCAYYLVLLGLKLALMFGSERGEQIRKERLNILWKWYFRMSVSILALALILTVIVYLMATDQGSKYYPGFLIYGVALYAFCKIIASAVNLIRAGRKHTPLKMSMKSLGLVDALVSILMLEIALIDTFGDITSGWARMMMALSGTGAVIIAVGVGVYGVKYSLRRLKHPGLVGKRK